MGLIILPRTRQRCLYSKFNDDIVITADSGNDALDFEDKVIIGNRKEPDGTTTESETGISSLQKSLGNELQGSDSGIQGRAFFGVTKRGNNPQTTARRRRYVYIDIRGNKNGSS